MNEHKPVPPHVLEAVHLANVRDHQLGGQTDGITPEVAADLGFTQFRTGDQVEHPNPFWPSPEQRDLGKAAIAEIRREHL